MQEFYRIAEALGRAEHDRFAPYYEAINEAIAAMTTEHEDDFPAFYEDRLKAARKLEELLGLSKQ